MSCAHLLGERTDRAEVGQVEWQHVDALLHLGAPEGGQRLLASLDQSGGHDDLCTVPGECSHRGQAETGVATRDDGNLAAQIGHLRGRPASSPHQVLSRA